MPVPSGRPTVSSTARRHGRNAGRCSIKSLPDSVHLTNVGEHGASGGSVESTQRPGCETRPFFSRPAGTAAFPFPALSCGNPQIIAAIALTEHASRYDDRDDCPRRKTLLPSPGTRRPPASAGNAGCSCGNPQRRAATTHSWYVDRRQPKRTAASDTENPLTAICKREELLAQKCHKAFIARIRHRRYKCELE